LTDDLAPIALFAYNRPEHLARAVDALRRDPLASSSDLHVFCDGPKTEAAADAVRQVRAFARSISGFKSLTVVERDRNIGLANSIIDGVTALCTRFGRVVVIEDDLIVAPSFLRFMNDGLTRYREADQVMQIAGYMFAVGTAFRDRAVFLPFPNSWGWATWQRAWRHFDPLMTKYAALRRSPRLRRQFDLDGSYDYLEMLEQQRRGSIDSWAIRWHLSCFMRQGLTLYPGTTLVQNIGFDGSGTHGASGEMRAASVEPLPDADHVCLPPSQIAVDPIAYARVKRVLRSTRPSRSLTAKLRSLWR
jgi:hypothetical protein